MGAGDDKDIEEGFIRAAVEEAREAGTTPIELLMRIVRGKFQAEARTGRVLVSTSEAGGTANFQVLQGLPPERVMALAVRAIRWLEDQPDPSNPSYDGLRQTRRLRFTLDGRVPL